MKLRLLRGGNISRLMAVLTILLCIMDVTSSKMVCLFVLSYIVLITEFETVNFITANNRFADFKFMFLSGRTHNDEIRVETS